MALNMTDKNQLMKEADAIADLKINSILNGCSDGVISVDIKGKIKYFNIAAENLSGYTTDEVIGKNINIFFLPNTQEKSDYYIEKYLNQSFETRTSTKLEVKLYTKSKNAIDVSLTLSDSGEGESKIVTGFLRIISDFDNPISKCDKMTSLVEHSSDFIAMGNSINGKVLYLNKAGRKLVGLKSNQSIIDKNIADFLTPKSQLDNKNTVMPTVIKNGLWVGRSDLKHFITGKSIPVDRSVFTIKKNELGKASVLGTIQRPISDKINLEGQLKKNEKLLQTRLKELELSYSTLPVGIGLLDINKRFIRVSDILAQINGISPEEHIGKKIEEVLRPESSYVTDLCNKVIKTGNPILNYETKEVSRFDIKNVTYWSTSYYPTREKKGKIDGIIVIAQEITELHKTKKALKIIEERVLEQYREFEHNYHNLPVGVATFDKNNRYIRINKVLASFSGKSIEFHLGKTVKEIAEEVAPFVEKSIKKVFETGKPLYNMQLKIAMPTDPNNLRDWLVNYYPFLDKNRQIIGVTSTIQEITELKFAENNRIKSEEKYRSIFENSGDTIILIDTKGVVLDINDAKGLSKKQIIGKYLVDLQPDEEGKKKILKVINEVLSHKKSVVYELAYKYKGELNYFSTSMSPMIIKNQVIGATLISRDITEQKLFDIQIKKHEKSLKQAQKIGKTGSWDLDLINNKLFWSEGMFEILEIKTKPKELTYESYIACVHPLDREAVDKAYTDHIEKKSEFNIVHRLLVGNKKLKYVHGRCESRWDEKGNPIRSLGTTSDITDLKLIELENEKYKNNLEKIVANRTSQLEETTIKLRGTNERLIESEKEFRFLAENSHDVVMAFNADLKRTYVSPSIIKLTGYTVKETLVEDAFSIVHPEDVHVLTVPYKEAIQKRTKDLVVKYRRKTKHKGYIWVETAISTIYDSKNKLNRIITTSRNITDQVEHEQELKKIHNQLIQSDKMASLGVLTAGVAHEINNPVNFISAGINSLEEHLKNVNEVLIAYDSITPKNANKKIEEINKLKSNLEFSKVLHFIALATTNIQKGAKRTSNIIAGLQSFSREDKNKLLLTNIKESIDNTLLILKNKYEDFITIVQDYKTIPEVYCYSGKINQVLLNILANAIDSIEKKGEILIGLKKCKKQGKGYIKITIADNGIGMSDKTKSKIFEPFFTTKEVGKGTGLGLSISHGIIEDHNGFIELESKIGKGTTFRIYLPL